MKKNRYNHNSIQRNRIGPKVGSRRTATIENLVILPVFLVALIIINLLLVPDFIFDIG